MKNIVIIFVVALALSVGLYFANKATRLPAKRGGAGAHSDDKVAGTPEPDLTLKDLEGKDISLAQYKGKVVLVNFWATWCEPCKVEIPWLLALQQKYEPKGFTVLGFAMDEEGKSVVAPFVNKERFEVDGKQVAMSYPILLGTDAAADKFGGLLGYPTSVLISRDGKIVKRITGIISEDEISAAIASQL